MDGAGYENLMFENCLRTCARANANGMVLAGLTQCFSYDEVPFPNEGDPEPDGGQVPIGECKEACFGDGDAVFGKGWGDYFSGSPAVYALSYPPPIVEETPAPSSAPAP